MSTGFDKIRKTAEEVAQRLGEAAQTASERLGEMRDREKLNLQIRNLQREKEKHRQAMADLVIRMLDQNTFVGELLRPEYNRIKEIDEEIVKLEHERDLIGQQAAASETAEPPAAQEIVEVGDVQEDITPGEV